MRCLEHVRLKITVGKTKKVNVAERYNAEKPRRHVRIKGIDALEKNLEQLMNNN